jgi:heat shock protein HtpX
MMCSLLLYLKHIEPAGQNEYLADEFAYKIGFGLELATVLDQHISDVPHDGFLSAIYSTHPCNDDRVAALQNLGVPYSRY